MFSITAPRSFDLNFHYCNMLKCKQRKMSDSLAISQPESREEYRLNGVRRLYCVELFMFNSE